MALRIVLLHSPLLGPSGWRSVAADLTRLGRTVQTPAWPRLASIEAGFYPSLADSLAGSVRADLPVVLIAHSGAGPLIPVLAERMAAAVAGVIFVDAMLPHPARSWFDTAPPILREQLRSGAQAGQLPSWDAWWPPGALARLVPDPAALAATTGELEPLPLTYFEEAAPTTELAAPGAYLQLSGAYDDEMRRARGYGWPVARLPLHHLAMLTHPQAVADAIASLVVALTETAHG